MVRLGFIIVSLALIGLLLSGLAAFRVYDHEVSFDQAALARAIETHVRLVQERLSERELLTRVAVGLIKSSPTIEANALKPLRPSIYAFKTDFVLASWIAHLDVADLPLAERVLAASGFGDPQIRNYDETPLARPPAGTAIDLLMDVEPRNSETIKLPGRIFSPQAALAPTLARALTTRLPVSSDPLVLPRSNQSIGLILVAPAIAEGANRPIGFVTFSYRLGPLMLTNEDSSLFDVTLTDPNDMAAEYSADAAGNAVTAAHRARGAGRMIQTVSFGQREWKLAYYAKIDPAARALSLAALVLAAGLALTAGICSLFGYVAVNNLRLRSEIDARASFETRLGAVIGELNHRVKNILAVTQSIVTRTLRPGADIDVARELLIGRIHAMSHVVSLLSDSYWQGVKLRQLLETRAIPHSDRIVATGPDITVSARAAQSLSLLFFELASHANDVQTAGRRLNIVVQWEVLEQDAIAMFHLRWEEFNVTAATRHEDNDFGVVLLDRVAPEALGGTSKRYFTDVSYVYELTAPMEAVIDRAEMDRTGRLTPAPRPESEQRT